jgi:hypothetical protein
MQIKINMAVIWYFDVKARSVFIIISCLISKKCSIMESEQTWLLLFLTGLPVCLTWVCTSKQKVLHSMFHVFMYIWLKFEIWNSFNSVMHSILLSSSTNFQFSIPLQMVHMDPSLFNHCHQLSFHSFSLETNNISSKAILGKTVDNKIIRWKNNK